MSLRHGDEDVRRLAGFLVVLTTDIAQAQADGEGPGDEDLLPSLHATEVILQAVFGESGTAAAGALSRYYLGVSRHMIARGAPDGLGRQWVDLTNLFRRAGDRLAELSDDVPGSADGQDDDFAGFQYPTELAPTRIAELARLLSGESVERHLAAGETVTRALGPTTDDNPLEGDERSLLRRVVAGDTVEQIADELGVSPRTVHRRLQAIWGRIGAASRLEGIALVSMRGWLDP